ncbi:MAG: TldD/PmbA family protein [Eubacteriales bacterium]|nr:TldD/PmbA family protein [Christensenellaceae bacterium]MDY2751314.1 TldD/PmbA family protein [Eubacteriales bacterium]
MYKFNQCFYSDIRIEDRYTSTIAFKNGVLDTCQERKEKRAFIRVFDGDLWLYASTSDIDDVQSELDNLYKQATPNKDIASNPIVKKYQTNVAKEIKFESNNVRNVSKNDKISLLKDVQSHIKSRFLAMSQVAYNDRNSVYEFYSSKGANIKYDYQMCGILAVGILAAPDDFVQAAYQQAKPYFDKISEYGDAIEKKLSDADNFVMNAKPCKKGKFPVILSPSAAGMFAHESFGHKSEADFMIGDEKMAQEWVLGKKVGSDILSIVDTGAKLGSGYVPFDDEGTRCTKTYLIKNGILCGRLHSATTAAALNEELTGNARAIDCKFEPIVRMTNTYIEPGNNTFDELVAGIKEGYYIDTVSHGSGGSTFTIAPSIAYAIKDGKLADPVKISVVTGDVFGTLNLIDGLTDKTVFEDGVFGGCGKMEQFPLHILDGGPFVRVKEMNVQ